jgi:hypothetical protein
MAPSAIAFLVALPVVTVIVLGLPVLLARRDRETLMVVPLQSRWREPVQFIRMAFVFAFAGIFLNSAGAVAIVPILCVSAGILLYPRILRVTRSGLRTHLPALVHYEDIGIARRSGDSLTIVRRNVRSMFTSIGRWWLQMTWNIPEDQWPELERLLQAHIPGYTPDQGAGPSPRPTRQRKARR